MSVLAVYFSPIGGSTVSKPMERKPPSRPAAPPQDKELVRGWYTTYNEDGDFPNGYEDGDGTPVFAIGSISRDHAWLAVPCGVERDLTEWR